MAAVQPETKIGAGTLLGGKYKVGRELGRGGMAAVYEAEHINIGKKVAVKVLASELTNSAIVIERFFREARAVASVKSPFIVEVYDSGRLDDGRPFIAMELLEGESLYDRMARVRIIDAPATVRIIGQVSKGLMKAHASGIVHRDLKPENIHLCSSEDGEEIAKILDFGLAKFYAPVQTDEKTARLTREGAVFGTPAYMSPEQVKGQGTVDHRADLWALGCMTFECLTGRPVWNTEQGVAMTFAAIATAQLPIPSRLRADLPSSFDAWFRRALERDPNERFQTAKELAEELAIALGAPPISLLSLAGTPSQIEFDALAYTPRSASSPPSGRSPAQRAGSDDANDPIDLLLRNSRDPALSVTDLPPTAAPDGTPALPVRKRSRAGRWILSLLLLGGLGAGGWVAYVKVVRPRWIRSMPAVVAPVATASVAASESASAQPPPPEAPKWSVALEQGQQLLASGDAEGAGRRFKEAADLGGGAMARSLIEQVKAGTPATGPCKLVAISHPRVGYSGSVGRPAIEATSKGAVVAWTDDHEQNGHDHVYSVLIDAIGRPVSHVRDLSPEADYAMRPSLLSADDRVALLFWDKSGRDPGVKARWLDADGRVGGMSVAVGAPKQGMFWPAMDRAPDGSGFWVAWQANPDKEGDDVFLRHLDAELKPQGAEVRASDYEPEKGKPVKVTAPSVAIAGSSLFVAYGLERDRQHLVDRMRIPLASPDLQAGLQEKPLPKGQRTLGEAATVNEEKVGGEAPAIACTKDACFLVWQELDKGVEAALIDPARGTLLWRKLLTPRGNRPSVAITPEGQGIVAFYEAGRVRVAEISRDGVAAISSVARVTGDQPRPWIVPARARGEWLVSWLDVEAGHNEAFAARLQCRN